MPGTLIDWVTVIQLALSFASAGDIVHSCVRQRANDGHTTRRHQLSLTAHTDGATTQRPWNMIWRMHKTTGATKPPRKRNGRSREQLALDAAVEGVVVVEGVVSAALRAGLVASSMAGFGPLWGCCEG